MELYFLNPDFTFASAPIDDYVSLTWTDRYQEAGEFSLTLSPDLVKDAMSAAYVYNSERGAMEITGISYTASGRRSLTVTGGGLLGLLRRRIITATGSHYDEIADDINARVTAETEGSRAFSLPIQIYKSGTSSENVRAPYSVGQNLYDWTVNLLQTTDNGASISYDRANSRLVLLIYQGKDRTQSQTTNSRATFSQSYGNIREIEIRRSALDYRNVCVAYDGTLKYTYTAIPSGEDRREMTISVNSETGLDDIWAQCRNALAEAKKIDSVSGTADQSDMVYKRDYDLGDLCDITDDTTGISVQSRISEVTTVYEQGAERVFTSFGEKSLNLRQFIKRSAERGRVTYVTIREEPEPDEPADE